MAATMGRQARDTAADILDFLIDLARRNGQTGHDTITYGTLQRQFSIEPHRPTRDAVGPYLDLLTGYCIGMGVPPLTVLAVRESGEPGGGFPRWFPDVDAAGDEVRGHDWENCPPPPFPRQQ